MEKNSERTRQGYRDVEGPAMGEPLRVLQGPGCRLSEAKGGAHWHRNGSRQRHTDWVAGTSGRGWWTAGTVNVQVGGASHQESRWGAGEN